MNELASEARAFGARTAAINAEAAQRAALQILCGIDLDEALETPSARQDVIIRRLERALRAERIKGLRKHWSYDLNRHIALKQVLERFNTPHNEKERRR
jgi:hypothetical protein